MSETTFKKHLNDLKQVLGLIKGDIEKGPQGKIDEWYSQTLQVIYDYEDMIESIINARNDYDEDSLEDADNVFFQEENDLDEDIHSEDLQDEDEEEFDSEDIEIEDEKINTDDDHQTYEILDNNHKTITIKVILN